MASTRKNDRSAFVSYPEFEHPILELELQIENSESEEERAALRATLQSEIERIFGGLSAWQVVQLARHNLRPRMLDYTTRLFDDFIEMHGDRLSGDDPAMVGGIARFRGRSVMVVGQQKGVTTEERIRRQYGMAHPAGYRKAMRLMKMAERLHLPVLSFVDTPAAHPGIDAEKGGQGPAIAASIYESLGLKTPLFAVVLSEGGSGGALAIAVSDWVAIMEHAVYVICPPEQCANILWKDPNKKEQAAEALQVTARSLLELGVVDSIVKEPLGGAHRDPAAAADALAEEIDRFLLECDRGRWTVERRRERFRRMGVWQDAV